MYSLRNESTLAINKVIRRRFQNMQNTKIGPLDVENAMNPLFKQLQELLKEWSIDMFGEQGDKRVEITEKYNQNKIYMYLNLWRFYQKLDEPAKCQSILDTCNEFVESVLPQVQTHHTLKMCSRFYIQRAEFHIQSKNLDAATDMYVNALNALWQAIDNQRNYLFFMLY